jgi:predicted O-methyltransferase YrrM
MRNQTWTAVERYITESLTLSDPVLDTALAANSAAGLPSIDVAPNEGKLLYLLALLRGSRKILEAGTLGGYSAIWLARASPPEGKLITLEADPKRAETARQNIGGAGLFTVVDLRLGFALDTLPQLELEGVGPFDLIFIDADKSNNPEYLTWALKLCRPGSVIIVDNVVRDGAVIDENSQDPAILGVSRLFEMLAAEPRVSATVLQTVGTKGYDGFVPALVV